MESKTTTQYRSNWFVAERKLSHMTTKYLHEKHRRNLIQDKYDKLLLASTGSGSIIKEYRNNALRNETKE